MGRVKNYEEKKKAAKVFSSASGGGTRGPSKVDKRNQELPCPHCDRIFKQKQRLDQHIANQHADAAEEQPDAASSSAPAAPAPQPAPARFDVGSRAGFYTQKTPRMMLHEWCQRNKRPTPRFKAREESDGSWSCEVVLADPKDRDKDIVCFFGGQGRAGAGSEDEAVQRAAVAGLHATQGDRSLERVLPKEFVGQWDELGQALQEKKEREKHRQEREAKRAEAQRRQAARERDMQRVFISAGAAQSLEWSLSAAKRGEGTSGREEREGREDLAEEEGMEEVLQRLRTMGFEEADAAAAMRSIGEVGGEGRERKEALVNAAVEWICLNVPDERLPDEYASAGAQITVVNFAAMDRISATASETQGATEDERALVAMGHALSDARAATSASPDLQKAAWRLFCGLCGVDPAPGGVEGWEEEREALEAIYGDEASVSPSDAPPSLKMAWKLPAGGPWGAGATAEVEVEVPPGCSYPACPPAVLVRVQGGTIPPTTARKVLEGVAGRLGPLVGSPMFFEAASGAREELEREDHWVAGGGRLEDREPKAAEEAPSVAGETTADTVVLDSMEDMAAELSDEERGEEEGKRGGAGGARRREKSQPQRGPIMPPRPDAEADGQSRALLEVAKRLESDATHRAVASARAALPASRHRAAVLSALAASRVCVVTGGTGCGKSTQVPQMILEEATRVGVGGRCAILCSQPRRISAVGLAQRVAEERGERVGDSVGYAVRLESRRSAATRLLFCTTGVLLRALVEPGSLRGATHVVVDEVHERSVDSDLLLLLLKGALRSHPALRVVLMSATADPGLFSGYFAPVLAGLGEAPPSRVDVPGFTHPVRELFLEDCLELTGQAIGRGSKGARKGGARGDEREAAEGYSAATRRSVANAEEGSVNYAVLEAVVAKALEMMRDDGEDALLRWEGPEGAPGARFHCHGGLGGMAGKGAVLVFLPGVEEIRQAQRLLAQSARVRGAAAGGLAVVPLHGSLPAGEQAKVFQSAKGGARKVVLATNVAETSVTIPDVTVVIDTGLAKEMRYDAAADVARLDVGLISRAAATQRRGRAGRVRPGVCLRLFSRCRAWEDMPEHQDPEMLRAPLLPLCLRVKAAVPSAPVEETLAGALTPPDPHALRESLQQLRTLGALEDHQTAGEAMTPLGHMLVRMPVDPHVGKALIFGALLGCLDAALTVAAALGYGKGVFVAPMERRNEANAAKAALAGQSRSDHMAVVEAFRAWSEAKAGGRAAASQLCRERFISEQAMEHVDKSRRDLAKALVAMGIVDSSYSPSATRPDTPHPADVHAGNARVLAAALCAGFYPKVARVQHPPQKFVGFKGQGRAMEAEDEDGARATKMFLRDGRRVFVHPSSVNFSVSRFESGWLVYTELVETTKPFLRDTSMVPVYAMLFFGGAIDANAVRGTLTVDGWARFKAPGKVAVLVRELQAEVRRVLLQKIRNPGGDVSSNPALLALQRLVATDGQ